MTSRPVSLALAALVAASFAVGSATAAQAAPKPVTYKNCTALNKAYAHGVGKPNAKDKVAGRTKPVTNFTKNAALYQANSGLDRDRDGIACEKR